MGKVVELVTKLVKIDDVEATSKKKHLSSSNRVTSWLCPLPPSTSACAEEDFDALFGLTYLLLVDKNEYDQPKYTFHITVFAINRFG